MRGGRGLRRWIAKNVRAFRLVNYRAAFKSATGRSISFKESYKGEKRLRD